jgi:hypothetical protein
MAPRGAQKIHVFRECRFLVVVVARIFCFVSVPYSCMIGCFVRVCVLGERVLNPGDCGKRTVQSVLYSFRTREIPKYDGILS